MLERTLSMYSVKSVSCLLVCTCLISISVFAPAQTAQDQEAVRTFLMDWKRTNLIESEEFNRLKTRFGAKTLPLLAEFLSDKELGFLAQSAMDQIDSIGATPYKLKNLVNNDPNQQRDTFRIANNALKDYEWYVRAGQPAEDPSKPKPRFAPNTRPYPFKKELHDAAFTELTQVLADKPIGAEREAIETIGLTGTKQDLPLLQRYTARYGANPFLTAAMARLGEKAAFAQIETALKQPAKTHPEEPWHSDNGVLHPARAGQLVTSKESGDSLRIAMDQAAYTMSRSFIPLLLAHLDDPPGQFHGDYFDPNPASYAAEALSKIVFGKYSVGWTPEQWKDWAAQHPREAAGR